MPVTIIPFGIGGASATRIIRDADTDETLEANVNDGAATIHLVVIDNAANAAVEYMKFYDATTATVGTTDPDMILMASASVTRTYMFRGGVTFSTGLSYAMVTAGGTAGVTGPGAAVITDIVVG